MNRKIKQAILQVLHACDGQPMPQEALFAGVVNWLRPADVTRSDIESALKDVDAAGYLTSDSDDLIGRTWSLSTKGAHAARQL